MRKTWIGGVVGVLGAALLLSGCGIGTNRAGFVKAANKACSANYHGLQAKAHPKTTKQGIDFALNYYAGLDLAVSTLHEMSKPSHDAKQLDSRWIDPAQHSLDGFKPNLVTIRAASNSGDAKVVDEQLFKLRHVIGQGVDQNYLRSYGLNQCVPLFSPR